MRTSSEGESRQRTKRKGFFTRLLEALHRSRCREAIRVLRRYRHLIAGQEKVRFPAPEPESRQAKTGSRNTRGNTPDRKAAWDAQDPVRVT